MKPRPLKERLLEKIVREGDCWLWKGATSAGYGNIVVGNSRTTPTLRAHRAFYELTHGSVPKVLHHTCGNTLCVNPDHLEPFDSDADHARRHRDERLTCQRGHPWSEENTYVHASGNRYCRTCRRDYMRRARALNYTAEGEE